MRSTFILNSSVFIIVPTYNEGIVIHSTLQPLIEADYAVIVVDDGSNDDTWDRLADLPVYALRHTCNLGQGAALQTGMTFALQQGAEILVHFDADGQHRSEDIDRLITPLRKGVCDVVLGSRFLRQIDRRAVPFFRRLLLRGAVIINGFLVGAWLSDAHNGFRALSAKAAVSIHLRLNGAAHASEIIRQIRRSHLRYIEEPTTVIYSYYTKAKGQTVWHAFDIVIDLLLERLFP